MRINLGLEIGYLIQTHARRAPGKHSPLLGAGALPVCNILQIRVWSVGLCLRSETLLSVFVYTAQAEGSGVAGKTCLALCPHRFAEKRQMSMVSRRRVARQRVLAG